MDQLEEELNKNVELLSQNHDCELMKGNFNFSKISHFLERIRMEHKQAKNISGSKLNFESICSLRIRSRKGDIVK